MGAESDSDHELDYDYDSLNEDLVKYIMIEYSDGLYNKNWIKLYCRNLHFRKIVKQRFLEKRSEKLKKPLL